MFHYKCHWKLQGLKCLVDKSTLSISMYQYVLEFALNISKTHPLHQFSTRGCPTTSTAHGFKMLLFSCVARSACRFGDVIWGKFMFWSKVYARNNPSKMYQSPSSRSVMVFSEFTDQQWPKKDFKEKIRGE